MNEDAIQIRSIQHYLYCPRRFALLEIDRDWQENAFVAKADLLHEHVHDGSHSFSDHRKTVCSALFVYREDMPYGIYGKTDCVEFLKAKDGVAVPGLTGTYRVRLVEYKPKAPKDAPYHETDAIQVFAQKVCADQIWQCDSEAYLYYADTRKRVKLPFDTAYAAYDAKLRQLLEEMRALLESHVIPARKRGQKCSGCSIADLCLPKQKPYCVREKIDAQKGGDAACES